MDDAEGEGVLAVLADVREHLRRELVRLADKRKKLIKQRKAQRRSGELEEVDSELEAAGRMLRVVEATEEELEAQGQDGSAGIASDVSSVQAGQEVRRGGSPTMSPSRPLTYARVATSARRRLPSSELAHLRRMSICKLSPFLWESGRTICCRC
jgi:hypothetical protein